MHDMLFFRRREDAHFIEVDFDKLIKSTVKPLSSTFGFVKVLSIKNWNMLSAPQRPMGMTLNSKLPYRIHAKYCTSGPAFA